MKTQHLEDEIQILQQELAEIKSVLKSVAIGGEQLWEVVFEDILDRSVPDGEDLRDLVREW